MAITQRTQKQIGFVIVLGLMVFAAGWWFLQSRHSTTPPNFLLVITDDQSWAHTGYAGDPVLRTPNFDRIAEEGVYFDNGYTSAPTCTAARSAILAGQHFWRLGSAAQLWGDYPKELVNYQQLLQQQGYLVGYTGKGWGPGKSPLGNPAGKPYSDIRRDVDPAFSVVDHVANFRQFLAERKPGQPFSFWVSPTEPHRPFKEGIGVSSGRFKLADIPVPPFLPDDNTVRGDIADYLYEIEWFDEDLGRVLALLDEVGELDNTVIVVTSDNGMAFPRAKSNNYAYGTHVPLVIRWPDGINTPHRVTDFVSLTDLAPTFLSLANAPVPPEMTGRSLLPQLQATVSGRIDPLRNAAFTGFQRHIGDARIESRGYPSRAIHTDEYVYIENFTPDRWPAGRPPGYEDIDNGSPTKNVLRTNEQYREFLMLAGDKRPRRELYKVKTDPGQISNLAGNPEYKTVLGVLAEQLQAELLRSGDPQVNGNGAVFDSYPYHGGVH